MRVQAAPPKHFPWLTSRTGCVLTEQARAIEALDGRGLIRGMVAYDGWTENSVQAHMAVDTPIVWRSLLGPAFEYPFTECDKGVLIGIIPGHNARSVAMTRSLGFQEAHRVRDGWAKGDDLVVFEMRREECRHLRGAYG
jgi:L-amino acid N-acyltransferase YncA